MPDTLIEPDTPCTDVWPPGTADRAGMMAYKHLEAEGLLRLVSVTLGRKTGVVTIRYLISFPWEWVKIRLREAREKGVSC